MATEYVEKQAAISLPVLPKEHRHYQTMNLDDAYEDGWFDAIECVEKIPPADVRPVVRGKWVLHPDPNCKGWDVCTACGIGCKRREYGTNPDGTDYVTEWSYPYCPNCGSYNGGDADG